MYCEVIVLAGGSGRRLAAVTDDKVLLPLAGQSAFRRCLVAFAEAEPATRFIVVYRDDAQRARLAAEAAAVGLAVEFVPGGTERGDSVRAGLACTRPGNHVVHLHDGARGLIHPESIRAVHAAAATDGGAVLAHPVTDTIKRLPAPDARRQTTLEDLDRRLLWAMETPQSFHRDAIVAAYAAATGPQTDDTAVFAAAGHPVTVVPNSHPNPKLTRPEDVAYCATLLASA